MLKSVTEIPTGVRAMTPKSYTWPQFRYRNIWIRKKKRANMELNFVKQKQNKTFLNFFSRLFFFKVLESSETKETDF